MRGGQSWWMKLLDGVKLSKWGGTIVKWVWVKLLIGNECIYIECALGNEDSKELPLLYTTTHEGYITIFFSPPYLVLRMDK